MTKMESLNIEKNYNHCPLKKRPVNMFSENKLDQDEPMDLSKKNESCDSISETDRDTVLVSPDSVNHKSLIDEEDDDQQEEIDVEIDVDVKPDLREATPIIKPISEIIKPTPVYWHSPVEFLPYPIEQYDSSYYHHPHVLSHHLSPVKSEKKEQSHSPVFPVYMPPVSPPSRVNHNNNIIKTDLYMHQPRFMPYHIGQHPAFATSPLSPASSHASFNSLESSRRSVSPASTGSLQSSACEQTLSTSSILKDSNAKVNKDSAHKQKSAHHYQCHDCGKSYSTYSGLSKHQQFHCPAVEGNQEKKVFSCKYCDKVYTSLGALKMHIRTHTLPCKCHICGKAFSRPWLLQGHIRTHTGEKPFSCQHCHRAFADRSNLRAHLQTHSDIKKYNCVTCSKTFSRMSLLTKHSEGGCPGLQMPVANSGGYMNAMVPSGKELAVY